MPTYSKALFLIPKSHPTALVRRMALLICLYIYCKYIAAPIDNGVKYAIIYLLQVQLLRPKQFYQEKSTMPTLMRQINVISRCGGMFRTERLKETELSGFHTAYILTVCRHPGISQDQLARHICINRSNVTRQLAYLEEHGFVERRQSESDRRVLLVYPTEKAQAILPTVLDVIHEWNDYITAGFSEDELDQLCGMMDRIAERAQEYDRIIGGNE